MKHKETIYIAASVLILIILAGGAYWYFLMAPVSAPRASNGTQTSTSGSNGFQPLDRTNTGGKGSTTGQTSGTSSNDGSVTGTSSSTTSVSKLATLRMLSSTPVGGYGASTTARTTVVRWVDRGRGNVYEASYESPTVTTISNTVVPRIYESAWNRNLTAFIGSIYQDDSSAWMAVHSQLVSQSTSTGSQVTPFALRGKKLPANVISYAVSPRKDKLVMLTNESGTGIGYTSNLDGSGVTQIFTTPLTQVNLAWPSDNIITVTTKGSALYSGFLYFVNPKTGAWTKILGPVPGLSASVSHDGKYVLWSGAGNSNNIVTGIYSVAQKSNADAGIITLADKCAWGNLYTAVVYCAVPSAAASATYPDDWYQGIVSNTDKIWQVDASSGIVKVISSVIDQSDRVIDGFKLDLDSKDSYLFFMNKNDLSLWSLDLVASR